MQGLVFAQGFDGCLLVPETKVTRKGQNGHFLEVFDPKHPGLALARLGKLALHRMTFSINRNARGEVNGFYKLKKERKKSKRSKRRRKKKSRGAAESNHGSFHTSFLLLALYAIQQSVRFS